MEKWETLEMNKEKASEVNLMNNNKLTIYEQQVIHVLTDGRLLVPRVGQLSIWLISVSLWNFRIIDKIYLG